jgi:mono/diheme cytochrome c family protein
MLTLTSRRPRRRLAAVVLGILCGVPQPAGTQDTTRVADVSGTTLSGVYSAAQAIRGKETFEFTCLGCHTTASHTGPAFMGPWEGKPLAELFLFIRYSMPKSEPGTLSPEEYAQVTAYILQLNGMPDGPGELPAESAALSIIRIRSRGP